MNFLIRKMKGLFVFLLLILSCLSAKIKIDDQDNSVVVISNGPIQGVVYDDHRAFRSIPYAQPPIGNLRWASPEPASSWSPKTLNATTFGAGCPQNCELPPHTCPEVQSEDCLTLNVYTPLPSATPLPVMVFLPGGRFEQGTASCTLYDGGYFVAHSGVILVTVSYRLGVLGWLVTGNLTGNYGLQDQRLALQWVQENIAAFGGDPKQVTLFGQSAGASSTAMHLISQKSAGLFQQAIMESIPMPLPMKPADVAGQLGELFTNDLGCSVGDVDCMRSKDIDDILAAQKESQKYVYPTRPLDLFLPWTPCVDGTDIVDQPLVAFESGNFHKVPIMTGTMLNDAYLFIYQAANGSRITDIEYMSILGYVFLDEALAVAARYPPDPFGNDTRPLLSVLGTDYIFYCSNRNAATSISSYSVPFYSYRFNHILSFDPWGEMYDFCIDKVCHGAELPILFHSAAPYYKFSPQEEQLSADMITYWTNFAKFGSPNDPNNKNLPYWPQYSPSSDQVMVFEDAPVVFSGILQPTCEFWDSMGYTWGT